MSEKKLYNSIFQLHWKKTDIGEKIAVEAYKLNQEWFGLGEVIRGYSSLCNKFKTFVKTKSGLVEIGPVRNFTFLA